MTLRQKFLLNAFWIWVFLGLFAAQGPQCPNPEDEVIIDAIEGNSPSADSSIFTDGVIITGEGFGENPTVSLIASDQTETNLSLRSASDVEIEAVFPESLQPGEYNLEVTNPDLGKFDSVPVTILEGAQGPSGPAGNTGSQGVQGATGATGAQGGQGVKAQQA